MASEKRDPHDSGTMTMTVSRAFGKVANPTARRLTIKEVLNLFSWSIEKEYRKVIDELNRGVAKNGD